MTFEEMWMKVQQNMRPESSEYDEYIRDAMQTYNEELHREQWDNQE